MAPDMTSVGPSHGTPLGRGRVLTVRLVLATVAAAVVMLPVAAAWAVTQARIHEPVGITPTTFSLTVSGHSEVRLGVAGRVLVPRSRGPFGVVAQVDGPGEPAGAAGLGGDLASYVSPTMLQLYSGLFHDPASAVDEYVELLLREVVRQLLLAEIFLSLLGGLGVVLVGRLLGPARTGPRSTGGVLAVAVAATVVTSSVAVRPPRDEATDVTRYDLPALAGTPVAGSTTDSPVIRLLLEDAVPKVKKLVRRQEDGVRVFQLKATRELEQQSAAMAGPKEGETALVMQSDMHCNTTMIALQRRVVSLLSDLHGRDVPAGLAITGDLTTNGTAAEGGCIKAEAAIADGRPIAAVTGNHESLTSMEQMRDAGMKVLDESRTDLDGLSVLGAADPNRSELLGATNLRGTLTDDDVGKQLRATAEQERPDLVIMHEAYAAAPFLGVRDMTTFLKARGSALTPFEDGVADVPAGAVFYGHWHRSVGPRVVWNSDGTWTLVMELDTSGGAIDTPTLNHFSTPWSRPQQEASFPVVFWDSESGLVTGYQLYRFATDGTVTVEPRTEVGDLSAPRGRSAAG